MTWRTEKTDEGQDLVWEQVETGIAVSPTLGTANIQNANISTETGEVLASYGRVNQAQLNIEDGTLTPDGDTLFNAPANLKAGTWIKVTASTVSGITASTDATTFDADYLVVGGGGGGGGTGNIAGANDTGGGGGGGGEVATGTGAFSVGSYDITIGDGGAGGVAESGSGDDPVGQSGEDSVIESIVTAIGGGGGGAGDGLGTFNGQNGGNGGGGGADQGTASSGTGGTGTAGFNGGAGVNNIGGGGGGGASQNGFVASGSVGGAGGAGETSSIDGISTVYAGGGGGGSPETGGGGGGGNGGGGNGGQNANGQNGTANTGGGGGGASTDGGSANRSGGNGGSGIIIISYPVGSALAKGGTVTIAGGNVVHTFLQTDVFEVIWVNPGGYYYVSYEDTSGDIKLSEKYDPYAEHAVTHGTTGSITFDIVATVGPAIAKAVEKYGTATNTEYRYYVLDSNGFVWVYDSGVYDASLLASGVGTLWMLPDPTDYSSLDFTGMNVLNGWLSVLNYNAIYGKPTVDLGTALVEYTNMKMSNPFPTHINYAFVGNQDKMFYTDGNYIGEVFPTNSFLTSLANIQSYGEYTADFTTGRITSLVGGSLPYTEDANGDVARIPAVFFTDVYGTQPTSLSSNTVYWIEVDIVANTFGVYATITGGSAIDIETGATGNQYFNTFFPIGTDAGSKGTNSTVQFTQQRVNLPYNEVAQCIVEVGNTVIIGGTSNILYPWNQIDATPSDFIYLPEANVKTMINVNNMVYVFAGNKGNVYITNNAVASLVLKVPDYCAGVPGSQLTYIEPYFTWGDAMYLRGRVYFSILDQTATKAGNCGGVWSFMPSQNFSYGQDIGLALRLENQNSYGDYDGYANILIPSEEQRAISPQYWAFWQDSYDTATANFGTDFTNTVPVTQYIVETDLLPTGTLLSKDTFTQLEYKLTTELESGDSVQLYWRLNSTDAWTSAGTTKQETDIPISGYYDMNFQKTQWIQFRAVVTTPGTTASSFVRLKQIRLR